MTKYIRKNAHVEAVQINTVEEARELAKKLDANRFGVEEFHYPETPDEISTQITIVRTKQHPGEQTLDLRFELGCWVVQGLTNDLMPHITPFRDREFKKYFESVEEN